MGEPAFLILPLFQPPIIMHDTVLMPPLFESADGRERIASIVKEAVLPCLCSAKVSNYVTLPNY